MNGSDHTTNGWSAHEPRRFDPSAFDPGPDLPPLPTLRPLPVIPPLHRWAAEPPAAPTPSVPPLAPPLPAPAEPTAPLTVAPPAQTEQVEPASAEPPVSAVAAAPTAPVHSPVPEQSSPQVQPTVSPEPPPVPPELPAVRHRRRSADVAEDDPPVQHTHLHEAATEQTPAPPVGPDLGSVPVEAERSTDPAAAPLSDTRRILVLGGSGTVGSAIVRALAAQGARVAVHHASRAAETDELIETLPGEGHLSVSADLADADAVGELVRAVDARFDGLDVVINAATAGDAVRHMSVVDSSLSDWTDAWTGTLTVDVLGAATTAHAAAAAFIARGQGGRIILLAARGRPFAGGRGPVTVATEHAVAALGSALALELAPYGVGVVVVGSGSAAAPGWSPEDLAATVAWLATGPASALAGATLNIAG